LSWYFWGSMGIVKWFTYFGYRRQSNTKNHC
jgi:hypothetical protein